MVSNRPQIFEYGYSQIHGSSRCRLLGVRSTRENRPKPRRSPPRKIITCADAKVMNVQEAFSHDRYESRVHVESEVHSRTLVNSAGSELGALLRIHKKE